jgi:hypothetical protein
VARYGQEFKDNAVARLLPPESASIKDVALSVGVSESTLERWRSAALEVIHDGRLPLAADAVHRNLDAAEIVLGDSARPFAHRFSRLTGWSWRRNKAQICNVSAGTKKKPAFFRGAGFRQRKTGSCLERLWAVFKCNLETAAAKSELLLQDCDSAVNTTDWPLKLF